MRETPRLVRSPLVRITHALLQLAGCGLVLASLAAAADDPNSGKASAGRPAVLCPVTQRPIEKTLYAYLRGKRVYFATAEAKAKFEANPFEYAEGAKKQWTQNPPLRTQVRCPVSDKPIDKDVHVEGPDDRIYFASEEARATWATWPAEKQRARLETCYVFQTKCPVSGNDIDPTVARELKGRTVYFFCKYCAADGEAEPEKFIAPFEKHVRANRAAWEQQHGRAAPRDPNATS